MPDDRFPRAGRRWHQGWEEVVVAAVLLVGAIFFRLRIDVFVRGRQGSFLGPEFWPATLLTVAIVLSAVYLVLAVVWARRQSAERDAVTAGAPGASAGTTTTAATTTAATTTAATTTAATTTPVDRSAATAPVDDDGPGAGRAGATAVSADPGAVPHDPAATTPHDGAPADGDAATAPTGPAGTGSVAKLVGGFLLLAAFIYLLAVIGFVPSAYLFSVAFMLLVGERRWYVLLLFPAVAVTILLGVFTQLLVVSLPRGTGIFVDLSTYFY